MTALRATGVKRLGILFQDACDAVFLLDPTGRFSFVNPAWEGVTGLDAQAALGQDPAIDGPDALRPFAPPHESRLGQPSGGKVLLLPPDGQRLWRRVEFWPFRNSQGHHLGILGIVRDADASPQAPDSPAHKARAALTEAREAIRVRFGHETLVGFGSRHERLLAQIAAASRVVTPALIVGEPGTGKRLVASVIHERGTRAGSPFLVVDVAALTPEMLDRELFGAEGGSTPLLAVEGATVLLASVDRLPRDVQARLVASLEHARARVLGATSVDPEQALADARFREDFYFAISVQVLRLAPLRQRADEVPVLAQHFLELSNKRGQARVSGFSTAAIDVLRAYDWPGNLRELARVVAAAHGRAADPICPDDLPAEIRGELASPHAVPPAQAAVTPLDQWLTRLERRLIEQALLRARQNKSRAADLLEISRPRLYRRIKELNIPDDGDASPDANGRAE